MVSVAYKTTNEHPKDDPTLFFIHGWPDDSQMWHYQVKLKACTLFL